MMIAAEKMAAKRRLTLLRILAEADGVANTSMLETALRACGFAGKALPLGCVEEDCERLAREGYVFVGGEEGQFGRVITVRLGRIGVAYLAREVPEVSWIEYPRLGI